MTSRTSALAGSGEARVGKKLEYKAAVGGVEISDHCQFESIPQTAWNFQVCGYQPAQNGSKTALPG